MRSLSAENLAALNARQLILRDFLWIVVRSFETGDPVADGVWSGLGQRTFDVINPNTGGTTSRTYFGSGNLVQISAIPLVANVTVQSVTIKLSQVADRMNELVRGYDCDQAQVEIHRGLFQKANPRVMVAPAFCRFVGFVDKLDIKTPAEGGDGAVTLTCKSHTQELRRANADMRSHESQQLRLAGDAFFADSHVAPSWDQFWGRAAGRVATGGNQRK